jgi:ribose transport system substrate-binding protein
MRSKDHSQPRRLRVALALVAVAVAVVAAGCGGSSNSGSTSSSADTGSATTTNAAATQTSGGSGVAAAQAFAHQSMSVPSTLGLQPTAKPIPAGKTVTYVHCGVDVCTTIANAIKNAAKVLGWNVRIVPSDGSPQGVKSAWDTVVRIHPAVAFGSGFPSVMFASEVKQLKAEGTPVMLLASTDTTGGDITLAKMTNAEVPIVGKEMAAWVISTTGGKANTLYANVPTFPILQPVKAGFEAAYKQWCPSCQLASIDLPITSIGKDAPSRIVSYLRANPSVNRVALGYDGLAFGLPAALKAAGLSGKVQFIGEAPTETNFSYVRSGQEGATVSQAYYEIWSMMLDGAARSVTGQSVAQDVGWKVPWFLVTKQNINTTGTGFGPVIPNLTQQLTALWRK